jgi:SHS2 domain-containing protein
MIPALRDDCGMITQLPPPPESRPPCWEHFAHAADIGVRGYGRTPDEAFAQAALAMMAVITDPQRIEAHETVTLECRAPDLELLLADWLNALVFTMATRHLLFCGFDVQISGHHLHATAWGEPLDALRHQPAVEVKGATFTELRVACLGPELWLAQCVVDV